MATVLKDVVALRPVVATPRLTVPAGSACPAPPVSTAYKDNTFEFIVKSPSVTWFLKKAAGIELIIGTPNSMGLQMVKDLRVILRGRIFSF
ncbi:50S ribosomal protein L11 [Rhynchospora pubera]|uniref:50S ribosomal protein L11 n=1 Tax=Rhynchospora pubera TaxID=906938 RepID=A0AAV8HYI2_9POAL|nr:50S ribosomal protein L11 [Rhynchospora pubera]